MNQIDTLIDKGIINKEFLKEEIRNDFLITKERKEIWAVCIDLYKEFERVCIKNNLSFFAISGTILGTVRHKGFVPWDDDIDVVMFRNDYEKLKNLYKEFKYPYELVWPGNEKENGWSYIRLCNTETTAISKNFDKLNINFGICLDIFPIDKVDVNTYFKEQDEIKEMVLKNYYGMKDVSKAKTENQEIPIINFKDNFEKMEKLASNHKNDKLNKIAQRTIFIYSPDKLLWDLDDFSNYIELPFEHIKMRIPIGWEHLLTCNYGDWKKFPPLEKRGSNHSSVIMNATKSYKDYLNR